MEFLIRKAEIADIEELLKLYFVVYQNSYPLALGTDPKVMTELIAKDDNLWLIAVNPAGPKQIMGSAVFEVDQFNRIAKLEGVVIHPESRGHSIASKIIQRGADQLLDPKTGIVDSIYTTTRTISKSPQVMCLNSGFRALGIFPNAHKLERYETLTLLAKHKEGVLDKRQFVDKVPEKLLPLYELTKDWGKNYRRPQAVAPIPKRKPEEERRTPHEFEFVFAPSFVYRRFLERFADPASRFYPFHKPNLLICSTKGDIELYCYLSKQDHYCTIIGTTVPVPTLVGRIPFLMDQLGDYGASYIELLVPVNLLDTIQALVEFDFIPSALYPAMRPNGHRYTDFVVMSHSMHPLNFAGMSVDTSFKPFIDQYVELWKQRHLDVLEVFKKNE